MKIMKSIMQLIRKAKYEKFELLKIKRVFNKKNNAQEFYLKLKTKVIGYQTQDICYKKEKSNWY